MHVDADEEIDGTVAAILAIVAFELTRLGRDRLADLADELDRAYMNGALSSRQWPTKTIAHRPFSLIGDVRYWQMRTFHQGHLGRE
jgi:hypothetical protein